ncbi:MAG: hypothetical protein KDD04_09160 [Sinomicrobium sp.]|nr:hypothetical protein [Sinomicrobium sp.]
MCNKAEHSKQEQRIRTENKYINQHKKVNYYGKSGWYSVNGMDMDIRLDVDGDYPQNYASFTYGTTVHDIGSVTAWGTTPGRPPTWSAWEVSLLPV